MSQPLIVEAVTAAEAETLRSRRDAASRADMVELRIDTMRQPDAGAAMAGRRGPVLVTCRASWEGGFFQGDERDRLACLEHALRLGAEFVDLEWRAAEALARFDATARSRVVLSMHDFEGLPDDLETRLADMRRFGTGVVKIAVHVRRLRDLHRLLAIGRDAAARQQPTVIIGMGMAGVATRVLPGHFGSCWTYAGNGVAPGQVPVDRLLDEFRVDRVRATTPVYAVVGRPIGHSVSPAMHNAAFAAHDLDGVYIPCEAEDFDDFLAFADVLPIIGASVTAPFKEAAAATVARTAGGRDTPVALNTVRRRPDGGWDGLNTDVDGFMAPLLGRPVAGLRAAVIGAGGLARSVVAGLREAGAAVAIHARREDAASGLAAALGVSAGAWPIPGGSWDLLVNTTPVGTAPDVEASPMAGQGLDGACVYDLIYNPRPTRLLRDAAAAGCATIDGLEMLVAQAIRQFAWWTEVTPAADTLRRAAERRLEAMAAALTVDRS